jgi:tetratricopeptide (TPR) repeat protein
LVIAAAGYIILGTDAAASIRKAWNIGIPNSNGFLQAIIPHSWKLSAPPNTAGTEAQNADQNQGQKPAGVLLKEAHALAAEHRFEESKAILRRILESDPSYQPALNALKEMEVPAKASEQTLEESVSRISALLNSGKFQAAKIEIDRLQQIYPDAAEIQVLRKRWQVMSSKPGQEQSRKDEEQKAISRQKEDEWNRQLTDFFARGKYGEASGALSIWLTENPGSPRAQELSSRLQEIQRHLKAHSSAMSENKYQDALNALSSAEKINPSDPGLAELRHQTETRKAAARATLTVHRLGARGTLLLDGRPIGKDGEIDSEAIPIGSHTLSLENGGVVIASRIQDYTEGQRVTLV